MLLKYLMKLKSESGNTERLLMRLDPLNVTYLHSTITLVLSAFIIGLLAEFSEFQSEFT